MQTLRAGPSPITFGEIQLLAVSEHATILDALAARDVEAAKAAVRAHIAGARRRAIAALELEQAAEETAPAFEGSPLGRDD